MKIRRQKAYHLGKTGEEAALRFLKTKNYKIIKRGFRLYRGEIDIIAYDKQTLVFVEVKTRKKRSYGDPEESVTPHKQQQIKKIANGFLALNDIQDVECRFDVLTLVFDENNRQTIKHIQNAF